LSVETPLFRVLPLTSIWIAPSGPGLMPLHAYPAGPRLRASASCGGATSYGGRHGIVAHSLWGWRMTCLAASGQSAGAGQGILDHVEQTFAAGMQLGELLGHPEIGEGHMATDGSTICRPSVQALSPWQATWTPNCSVSVLARRSSWLSNGFALIGVSPSAMRREKGPPA